MCARNGRKNRTWMEKARVRCELTPEDEQEGAEEHLERRREVEELGEPRARDDDASRIALRASADDDNYRGAGDASTSAAERAQSREEEGGEGYGEPDIEEERGNRHGEIVVVDTVADVADAYATRASIAWADECGDTYGDVQPPDAVVSPRGAVVDSSDQSGVVSGERERFLAVHMRREAEASRRAGERRTQNRQRARQEREEAEQRAAEQQRETQEAFNATMAELEKSEAILRRSSVVEDIHVQDTCAEANAPGAAATRDDIAEKDETANERRRREELELRAAEVEREMEELARRREAKAEERERAQRAGACIANACAAYMRSGRRVAKLRAIVRIQAVFRGVRGRRRAQQARARRDAIWCRYPARSTTPNRAFVICTRGRHRTSTAPALRSNLPLLRGRAMPSPRRAWQLPPPDAPRSRYRRRCRNTPAYSARRAIAFCTRH